MDYEKICRVCMSAGKTMHDIFVGSTLQDELAKSIMSITTVKIEKNDGFPSKVCGKCVHSLETALKFKKLCEESDSVYQNATLNQTIKCDTEAEEDTKYLPSTSSIKQESGVEFLDVNIDRNFDENSFVEFMHEPDEDTFVEEETMGVEVQVPENNVPKVYPCNVCHKCYTGSKSLKRHMIIHAGRGFTCNQCQKVFSRSDHLKKHLQSIHKVQDIDAVMNLITPKTMVKYNCEYCNVDAPNKSLMNKHLRACHREKLPRRKNSLSQLFRDSESDSNVLREPEVVVDDRKTIGSVTTSSGGAVATIKEQKQENGETVDLVLEVQYCCVTCGIKYTNQHSYAAHMTKHSGPVPKGQTEFKCILCDKVFSKRKNLKQHVLIHNKEKANKCTLCHRAFTRPDQLILHMNNHTGKKKHTCHVCLKGFNMVSTLKDHLRTHTGERPYLCPICGRGFTQNTNLKQHIMRHNATKPFRCPECESRFVSKGELDAHLRKHTGDHPFVCDTCGSGFTTSSSLVKHKRIHTGERPYECKLCSARFTALGTLKNHKRIHTGEKPFACTFCTRAFAQKSDLNAHIRTHTGERPYACPACGSAHQQMAALKAHIKTAHPTLVLLPKIPSSKPTSAFGSLLQAQMSASSLNGTQIECQINPIQLNTVQIATPINTADLNTNLIIISTTPMVSESQPEQSDSQELDTFKMSTPENSQSPHQEDII